MARSDEVAGEPLGAPAKDLQPVQAVVFDIGRVIIEWDLRLLFTKLIADKAELDWFLSHVVTEEWHFQHDQGRPLDAMLAERIAEFPDYAGLIKAYRTRFLETIPGPVPGTTELIGQLAAREMPLYAITNFGAEFWQQFRPTMPVLDHFRDIVVSGDEQLAKPDPRIYNLAAERCARSRLSGAPFPQRGGPRRRSGGPRAYLIRRCIAPARPHPPLHRLW